MSFIKYRVKEVAADFGITPKEVSEIIGKFGEKPKSNTQVLSDSELNVVFDYMTQKNQIKSIEQVFAVKPAAPKAEPKPPLPLRRISSRVVPRVRTRTGPRVSRAIVPRIRIIRAIGPRIITRAVPRTITVPSPRTLPSSSPPRPLSPSVSVSAGWSIPPLCR